MSELPRFENSVNIITNKTLAGTDCGIIQDVSVDGLTLTLPATVLGLTFIIRNRGAFPTGAAIGTGLDGSVLLTLAPNASDGITGNGFTATVNKAALNTKATSQIGDFIKVVGTGVTGVTAWVIQEMKGTWARQA